MRKQRSCHVRPRKKCWYVYLLRCADGSLYCGMTNELNARIDTHNAGRGAKYTRSRLPVKLACVETVKTRSAALRREYQIKKLSKKGKEELCGQWQTVASINAVPHRKQPSSATPQGRKRLQKTF